MKYHYKTQGTCSTDIYFELNDGKLSNVRYVHGCNGNLQGIGKLVEGMKAEDVIHRLEGIRCGKKCTSCPDQLSVALKKVLAAQKEKKEETSSIKDVLRQHA